MKRLVKNMKSIPSFSTPNVNPPDTTKRQVLYPQASYVIVVFFLCVFLSKTERHASQRIWMDGSKSFVVSVPSRRVGPKHSAKVHLSQIVGQVVSRGATFPTVSSCQQRETHSRRRDSGLTRTRGEVGSCHPCRWRVGSHFPGTPRGSQTSTAASTGATSGEPDQVFGVVHRAGEEARGENTQGGGGREGQGCRRRTDSDRRVECVTGRRTASCSPLGGSIEDRRTAATTMPVDFAAELVQLRSLVVEFQREREELRSELRQRGAAIPAEEGRPRKSIRSLSTPASDLMPHNQLAISSGSGSGRNPSVLMETLIDGGSAAASHRLHPMQWRMGQLCLVGERSGQGTGCEACEWARHLIQGRLDEGEGWNSVCPRPKWTVTLTTMRGSCCRPADAAMVEVSPPREFDTAMDDSSAEEPRQADVGSSERQWVPRVAVENRFQVLSGQESDTESCEVSDRRLH